MEDTVVSLWLYRRNLTAWISDNLLLESQSEMLEPNKAHALHNLAWSIVSPIVHYLPSCCILIAFSGDEVAWKRGVFFLSLEAEIDVDTNNDTRGRFHQQARDMGYNLVRNKRPVAFPFCLRIETNTAANSVHLALILLLLFYLFQKWHFQSRFFIL